MCEQEHGDREHRQIGEQLLTYNNFPAATGVDASENAMLQSLAYERNDTITRRLREVNESVNKYLEQVVGKDDRSNLRLG